MNKAAMLMTGGMNIINPYTLDDMFIGYEMKDDLYFIDKHGTTWDDGKDPRITKFKDQSPLPTPYDATPIYGAGGNNAYLQMLDNRYTAYDPISTSSNNYSTYQADFPSRPSTGTIYALAYNTTYRLSNGVGLFTLQHDNQNRVEMISALTGIYFRSFLSNVNDGNLVESNFTTPSWILVSCVLDGISSYFRTNKAFSDSGYVRDNLSVDKLLIHNRFTGNNQKYRWGGGMSKFFWFDDVHDAKTIDGVENWILRN